MSTAPPLKHLTESSSKEEQLFKRAFIPSAPKMHDPHDRFIAEYASQFEFSFWKKKKNQWICIYFPSLVTCNFFVAGLGMATGRVRGGAPYPAPPQTGRATGPFPCPVYFFYNFFFPKKFSIIRLKKKITLLQKKHLFIKFKNINL